MRYCPDCDWMFPSHRLAWSGQCDGKLVWQGKYRTQRNYWCLFHFTVHTVCSTKWDQTLLLGPAWIDHGTLELTHKPGKYLWQPHCRGVCSGGCPGWDLDIFDHLVIWWSSGTFFGVELLHSLQLFFPQSNWGLSFTVPGVIIAGVGFLLFLVMVPRPQDLGFSDEVGKCFKIYIYADKYWNVTLFRMRRMKTLRQTLFLMRRMEIRKRSHQTVLMLRCLLCCYWPGQSHLR